MNDDPSDPSTDSVLRVDAPVEEVWRALEGALSVEQLAQVHVAASASEPADPFGPQAQRDLPSADAVVTFVSGALAGGALYDVVKAATVALVSRFRERVRPRDESGADTQDDDGPDAG